MMEVAQEVQTLAGAISIHGAYDSRFKRVFDEFEQNFSERGEVGAHRVALAADAHRLEHAAVAQLFEHLRRGEAARIFQVVGLDAAHVVRVRLLERSVQVLELLLERACHRVRRGHLAAPVRAAVATSVSAPRSPCARA